MTERNGAWCVTIADDQRKDEVKKKSTIIGVVCMPFEITPPGELPKCQLVKIDKKDRLIDKNNLVLPVEKKPIIVSFPKKGSYKSCALVSDDQLLVITSKEVLLVDITDFYTLKKTEDVPSNENDTKSSSGKKIEYIQRKVPKNIPFPDKDIQGIEKNVNCMVKDNPCYFFVSTVGSLKVKAANTDLVKKLKKSKHTIAFKQPPPPKNQVVSHWSFDLKTETFKLQRAFYVQDYIISIMPQDSPRAEALKNL